jgi:AraC-like DNA-binding protein
VTSWLKLQAVSDAPRNLANYWRDPDFPGLGLLHADFTTHEYRPHFHDEWVFAVTERGGAIVSSQGRVEEARHSALLVFNPAEAQAAWLGASRRWVYRAFYVDLSGMNEIVGATGMHRVPEFHFGALADPGLSARFLSLHRDLERRPGLPRQREGLIELFGRLFERHATGAAKPITAPRDRALFHRIDRLMRREYAADLTLGSIAEAAALSPFQLIGLFKRMTGLTPHAYLMQIRMQAARESLKRGAPIATAASEAGFYDQSALTNHFKRSYAITPRQFASAYYSGAGHRRQ